MMVNADQARPARILAGIADALRVSALGRKLMAIEFQPLRKIGAASDNAVKAGTDRNRPRNVVGALRADLLICENAKVAVVTPIRTSISEIGSS